MTADTLARSRPRFDPQEKRILRFTGVAHLLTHFVELSYPTLAVALAAETGLPLERVLGWSLGGYLLFGLGAMPAGFAADRFGERRVIMLGLLFAALSTFGAALSEPGWQLAVCMGGVGLGASAYHPAGMGLLSRSISARGAGLGINGIYGNVGIALAPLVTAALASWIGWRITLAAIGVALVSGALMGARKGVGDARAHDAQGSETPREIPAVISNMQIVAFSILCVTAMLGGFGYRGNTLAQPALFSERIDMLNFGVAASIAMSAGILGQFVGGRLADRYPLTWTYFAFHLASLPLLYLVTLTNDFSLLAVSSLFVFFALGMQPVENSLFAELTPERWRSTAYGLKFTLTFGIGSAAVVMVAWVAQSSGFVGVYRILSVVVSVLVAGTVGLAVVHRQYAGERSHRRIVSGVATPSAEAAD